MKIMLSCRFGRMVAWHEAKPGGVRCAKQHRISILPVLKIERQAVNPIDRIDAHSVDLRDKNLGEKR